jgi:hypothetical protein
MTSDTPPPSITMMKRNSSNNFVFLFFIAVSCCCHGLSLSSFSKFHGTSLLQEATTTPATNTNLRSTLTMRKQKASDRRTRRMQRGNADDIAQDVIRDNILRENTYLSSPMTKAGSWKQRSSGVVLPPPIKDAATTSGGRGRSRKRSMLYNSLSSYHNKFLHLLTTEFRAEVSF